MKYTSKQQRIIDYLEKLGDTNHLAEYKQRVEKRAAEWYNIFMRVKRN